MPGKLPGKSSAWPLRNTDEIVFYLVNLSIPRRFMIPRNTPSFFIKSRSGKAETRQREGERKKSPYPSIDFTSPPAVRTHFCVNFYNIPFQ